jgi:rhodanese-related sulfurtransferase
MFGVSGRLYRPEAQRLTVAPKCCVSGRLQPTSLAQHRVSERYGPPVTEQISEHRSLDRLIEEAASRITRFEPQEALDAANAGGLIIDIRSQDARERDGVIPGSLHIPRTVLEWRVAVESEWRSPYIGGLDQQLILICDHGYSSILAASNLVQLGFHRAADVIGGFEAWENQGLPIKQSTERSVGPDALPGTGPPE